MDFETIVEKLSYSTVDLVLRLIAAAAVIFVGTAIVKMIVKRIGNSKHFEKNDVAAQKFIGSFVKIALYILVYFTAAAILGVPTASMIALLGSCGLAVGLALQGGLANIAGGILIVIFKPFSIGDYISCAGGDGTVVDINIFYTYLKTPDNRRIVVPNGVITASSITDVSAYDTRKIDFSFLADYSDDIDKVKEILLKTATDDPRVLSDPAPAAFVAKHDADGVAYTLRVWCKSSDYWNVNYDINENVKKAFDKNGISIPYHILDVKLSK